MELQEYQTLLNQIKATIHQAQVRAALAVNAEGIMLYWQIGKMIAEIKLINDGPLR